MLLRQPVQESERQEQGPGHVLQTVRCKLQCCTFGFMESEKINPQHWAQRGAWSMRVCSGEEALVRTCRTMAKLKAPPGTVSAELQQGALRPQRTGKGWGNSQRPRSLPGEKEIPTHNRRNPGLASEVQARTGVGRGAEHVKCRQHWRRNT